MRFIPIALALAALVTGLRAAWLWLRSARITPDLTFASTTGELDQVANSVAIATMAAMIEASQLSARAAVWTAAAVIISTAASVASAWPWCG